MARLSKPPKAPPPNPTVWVLTWEDDDGSDSGYLLGVYADLGGALRATGHALKDGQWTLGEGGSYVRYCPGGFYWAREEEAR